MDLPINTNSRPSDLKITDIRFTNLKGRLLGENPCNVEKLFKRIRLFSQF